MEPNDTTTAMSAPAPAQPAPIPVAEDIRISPRITFEQLLTLPDDDYRKRWMNSLIEAETARQNYAQDMALARQFATSGQFDDLKAQTPAQAIATAMVKIQFGRTWRLEPADAMRSIYFANGRPAVENEIVSSRLASAGIEWETEFHEETYSHKGREAKRCIGVTLWLMRLNMAKQILEPWLDRKGAQRSVSFTQADADNAKVWEKGKQISLSEKWNFVSWPGDMYYWKAVSRVKKFHAPNVLRGAISMADAFELPPPELAPAPAVAAHPEMIAPQPQKDAPSRVLEHLRAQQTVLDPEERTE
jgi:hypothetical protein